MAEKTASVANGSVSSNSALAALREKLASPEMAAAFTSRASTGSALTLVNLEPASWLKLPVQARCILKVLALKGPTLTTAQICADLVSVGGLSTRQTPLRILMFYRKALLEKGFVRVAS